MRTGLRVGVWVGVVLGLLTAMGERVMAADPAAVAEGDRQLAARRFDEAGAAFRKALAADPDDTAALKGLAAALHGQQKFAEEAAVDEHLADVYLKAAGQAPAARPQAAPPPTAQPTPAVATAAVPPPPAPAVPAGATPVPLAASAIVSAGPAGPRVAEKSGKPVNGVKLSQHDLEMGSPSIAVAPDGTIHVAFMEKHRQTYAPAIYHRSSTDGGKTWSEARNLSEDMPNIQVGRCVVACDGQSRAYVIWRSGLAVNFPANVDPWANGAYNLNFRVLAGGKWSRVKPVHPPGSDQAQNDGSYGFFAGTDAAGRVQVLWNTCPDAFHPELTTTSGTYHQHNTGIGNGLCFQATLDGPTATPPREAYMPPVGGMNEAGGYGKYCDGFNTPTGYFDAAGKPHFLAATTSYHDPVRDKSVFTLVEDGKQSPGVTLPDLSFHAWADVPTLLVDAKGRKHVVALYPFGERPDVRDYLVGSEDDPTVIRAAKSVKGKCISMQAYQGPAGRMVVLMQMNDTGEDGDAETYVSMSDGGQWSDPVNVTNNSGRQAFKATQNRESGTSLATSYAPGPGAAAFDRDGHLVLALIVKERGVFGTSAFGVTTMSGSSETPTLVYLRF